MVLHRPSLKSLATPIALNSASKGPRPLINEGSTEKKQGCKRGHPRVFCFWGSSTKLLLNYLSLADILVVLLLLILNWVHFNEAFNVLSEVFNSNVSKPSWFCALQKTLQQHPFLPTCFQPGLRIARNHDVVQWPNRYLTYFQLHGAWSHMEWAPPSVKLPQNGNVS